MNNKIASSHERAPRNVYYYKDLTFKEFLDRGNSITTHRRNLQYLAKIMFRAKIQSIPSL